MQAAEGAYLLSPLDHRYDPATIHSFPAGGAGLVSPRPKNSLQLLVGTWVAQVTFEVGDLEEFDAFAVSEQLQSPEASPAIPIERCSGGVHVLPQFERPMDYLRHPRLSLFAAALWRNSTVVSLTHVRGRQSLKTWGSGLRIVEEHHHVAWMTR